MADPVMALIAREMRAREAVASVSLSHPEDCACLVCRAATGDDEALLEVMAALLTEE